MKIAKLASMFVLCAVFVLGAGSVSADNTLMNFFGGQTGLLVQPDESEDEYSGLTVVNDEGEEQGGFLSFIASLFSFTSTSESDTNSDTSSSTNTYVGQAPTLTCMPNTVAPSEPALIFWQCLDSSQTASAVGFSTGDSSYGSVRVNPDVDTTYSLSCASGAYAECNIDVVNSALALTVSTTTVPMWDTVELSWSALDVQNCELTSDDDSSMYKDWSRHGACSAATPCVAQSHDITKETVFTLSCTTLTGLDKETSVTVDVE